MANNSKKRQGTPRSYWGYLALLVGSLALFSCYAFFTKDTLVSFDLKKMNLAKYMLPDSIPQDSLALIDTLAVDTPEEDSTLSPTDSTGKVHFLLIGDSMNEYLRIRLNDYCIANGYDMYCVIWYGATTKQYGTSDTIAYFINKHNPTYVLLTIGSNELFVRDIIEKRTDYVKHIVKQLGRVPFVWIGPPNWKEDTGINEMIVTNVGESRYFESKKLKYNRYKDGAHPTRESAAMWMDSIAVYLQNDALKTIEMPLPDQSYKKVPHTTVLQMVRE
jgi:hypothetical protein